MTGLSCCAREAYPFNVLVQLPPVCLSPVHDYDLGLPFLVSRAVIAAQQNQHASLLCSLRQMLVPLQQHYYGICDNSLHSAAHVCLPRGEDLRTLRSTQQLEMCDIYRRISTC